MAQPMMVDFSKADDIIQHSSTTTDPKPRGKDGKLLTPKQIRARARRRMARNEPMNQEEFEWLYKPIEEWDLEELARGRPRNAQGKFSGPAPKWVDRTIHEKAMEKYTAALKTNMRATTVDAMTMIQELITNEDVDEKGKPIVPPGTKLEAAKFLIEHVVGKPTQRIENDVSVKLQGILGQVMVNPRELTASGERTYQPAHYPGITMQLATEKEYDDDDDFLPEDA